MKHLSRTPGGSANEGKQMSLQQPPFPPLRLMMIMRAPCARCKVPNGYVIQRGTHRAVYCGGCDVWQYHQPKEKNVYDNSNSGALFKEIQKKSDKAPDYSGMLTVDGKEYRLAGWKRESKRGVRFLSL